MDISTYRCSCSCGFWGSMRVARELRHARQKMRRRWRFCDVCLSGAEEGRLSAVLCCDGGFCSGCMRAGIRRRLLGWMDGWMGG